MGCTTTRFRAVLAATCVVLAAATGCGRAVSANAPALDSIKLTEDGYAYRMDLIDVTVTVTNIDTERSRPGQAVIDFKARATVRLHNLTDGRIAPGRYITADVTPVWDADSVACAGQREELFEEGSYKAAGGCTVLKDPIWAENDVAEIPEGGFIVLAGEVWASTRELGGQEGSLIFPEQDAQKAAKALAHPDRWVFVQH